MATAQMDTVIRHLRGAVLRQDRAGWTDGQLLGSFIDQEDEAAFEAIVRPSAFNSLSNLNARLVDRSDFAFHTTKRNGKRKKSAQNHLT